MQPEFGSRFANDASKGSKYNEQRAQYSPIQIKILHHFRIQRIY